MTHTVSTYFLFRHDEMLGTASSYRNPLRYGESNDVIWRRLRKEIFNSLIETVIIDYDTTIAFRDKKNKRESLVNFYN